MPVTRSRSSCSLRRPAQELGSCDPPPQDVARVGRPPCRRGGRTPSSCLAVRIEGRQHRGSAIVKASIESASAMQPSVRIGQWSGSGVVAKSPPRRADRWPSERGRWRPIADWIRGSSARAARTRPRCDVRGAVGVWGAPPRTQMLRNPIVTAIVSIDRAAPTQGAKATGDHARAGGQRWNRRPISRIAGPRSGGP